MQTRREFVSGATVTLLLIPLAAACGSSNGTPSMTDNASCSGLGATSSVANNHTHTVCVAASDLTNPPANGAMYTTSTTLNHNHTVTLTQAQLQTIGGGGSVTVTTTGPDPNHQFMLQKA